MNTDISYLVGYGEFLAVDFALQIVLLMAPWLVFYLFYCLCKKRRLYTDKPYVLAVILYLLLGIRALILMSALPSDAYYGSYSAQSLNAAHPYIMFLAVSAGWLLQRFVMSKLKRKNN